MNVMVKKEWIEKGYVDEPVDEALDLKAEIRKLCKEKDAIILAHYYTVGEIQDIADFVGDSLALARKAAETDAQVMVMCGVHFMAETCKLLSPDKTVICPDLNAGCSLADSCKAEDLKKYKEEHPGYKVVSYVNTTAAVKALTDCVVTSGNAKKVIDSFPQDEKIIFGPDYNLGNYINSVTGRNMLLWNGGCHVHEKFSVEAIVKLKQKHPEAVVMAHLECKAPVLAVADVKGSTATMLHYAQEHPEIKEYIIVTEAGILHELERNCPNVIFYPVPPEVSEGGVGCSGKTRSLEHIFNTDLSGSIVLIQAEEWAAHQFLERLHGKLTSTPLKGYMTNNELLDKVIALLNEMDGHPILVIDEADKLKPSALRQLIPIYNRTEEHLGCVLAGTENLQKEIKAGVRKRLKGYDEIDSRLGRSYITLDGATEKDVYTICEANGVTSETSKLTVWSEIEKVEKFVRVRTTQGEREVKVLHCEDFRRLRRLITREKLLNKTSGK